MYEGKQPGEKARVDPSLKMLKVESVESVESVKMWMNESPGVAHICNFKDITEHIISNAEGR